MPRSDTNDLDATILDTVARDAGAEAMPALIDAFSRDSIRREERLSAATETGDFAMIEQEAHALVSSARTFGATAMADLARIVEMACEDRRHDDAIASAKKLLRLAITARGALMAQRGRYVATLDAD